MEEEEEEEEEAEETCAEGVHCASIGGGCGRSRRGMEHVDARAYEARVGVGVVAEAAAEGEEVRVRGVCEGSSSQEGMGSMRVARWSLESGAETGWGKGRNGEGEKVLWSM